MSGGYRGLEGTPAASGGLRLVVIALPLLLYVFLPRPPIPGSHFLAIPAMAGILTAILLVFMHQGTQLSRKLLPLLLLLLLLSIATTLSFVVNAVHLRQSALAEVMRPVLFVVFLLYGYYGARIFGSETVSRALLRTAQWVLVGQAVIAATQLAGLSIFEIMYSGEKTRPLGSLVRITGSMANPSAFGWIVAQSSAIIFLLSRRRWPWMLLAALLITVSGSRTMLLVFPCIPILLSIWQSGGGWSAYLRGGLLVGVAGASVALLVLLAGDALPYIGQLRSVFFTGSLDSVNSFAHRLGMWESVSAEYMVGGPVTWAFGLGSRPSTRVLDNDYLYVLLRVGFVGLLVHASLMLHMTRRFIRSRTPLAHIGLQYLIFSLALGLVFETLGGWFFPLLLFFYVGLDLGLDDRDTASTPTHRLATPVPQPL